MVSRARPVVDESAQHVNRNLTIAGAMAAAGVITWLALRSQAGAPDIGDEVANTVQAATPRWTSTDRATAEDPATAELTAPEEEFQDYVDAKYRYLFKD